MEVHGSYRNWGCGKQETWTEKFSEHWRSMSSLCSCKWYFFAVNIKRQRDNFENSVLLF